MKHPPLPRMITEIVPDESYCCLQNMLAEDPTKGDLIKGGGGIRKIRYAIRERGKSSGIRVI